MNNFNRVSAALFIILISCTTVFSQVADTSAKKDHRAIGPKEESSKESVLRRITGPMHEWDFNIKIEEDALEASIEQAVERAMESVEASLDRLEIHIDPIEIDMSNINIDMVPIRIDLSHLDLISNQLKSKIMILTSTLT